MKIKKTLFSTEIEYSIDELESMHYRLSPTISVGLLLWIKKNFGLNLLSKKK